MAVTISERIIFATYYIFVGISGLCANTILLIVLYKSYDYRQRPSSYFLYSILIASEVACLCQIPYYTFGVVADLPEPTGNLYQTECRITVFVTYTISAVKIFMLAALSLDRYVAVSFPFPYEKHVTKSKVAIVNLAVLVPPVVLTIPLSAVEGISKYIGVAGTTCGVYWDVMTKGMMVSLMILGFVLPCFVILSTNIKVFIVARKQRRNISGEIRRHTDVKREKRSETNQLTSNSNFGNTSANRVADKCSVEDIADACSAEDIADVKTVQSLIDKPEKSKEDVNDMQCRKENSIKGDLKVVSCTDNKRSDIRSNSSSVINSQAAKENEKQAFSLFRRRSTQGENNENRTHKKQRKNITSAFRATEWSIIVSTLMIVATFVITWSPFALSRVYEAFTQLLGDKAILYTTALTLLDIVMNPLVILGSRKRLREKTFKLLCFKH